MRSLAVLASILAVGCAAGSNPQIGSVPLPLDPQGSIVEQNVARSFERFLQINEPVMDRPLRVVWGGSELEPYLATIRERLSNDMASERLHPVPGEKVYAILLASTVQDYVYVLRIDRIDETGAYRKLPGLIYTFDRPSGVYRSVRPSFY